MTEVSPSTTHYYIGKGAVYFTPSGGSERHLGNCSVFELAPEIEELEHFSSMAGVRSKDRGVVLEKSMVVRMVLDEYTGENLALQLLGTIATNSAGNDQFSIFTLSEILGQLRFAGANDVGHKMNVTLPSCSFKPTGVVSLISEEWGELEVEAEVLIVAGSFGTVEITPPT
jgi:hypothetical protein